jgi:hypothetical protein
VATYDSTTNGEARGAGTGHEASSVDAKSTVPARTIVFVLASVALAVACVLLALRYFFAERLPDLTEGALEAAMAKWDQNGPASYDMDIELRGARPGNVHVEVRAGQVTAHTRDGRIPNESTWYTWSVPGMFDMLARDIQIAENPQQEIGAPPGAKWWLRCEFDPQFGYPARYHQVVTGGGPEVLWQVVKFQPQ